MPIREDDNQPNRRFGIINLVLIGFGVLLLISSFVPNQGMQQVPRVPEFHGAGSAPPARAALATAACMRCMRRLAVRV